jgi:hypothetical protein
MRKRKLTAKEIGNLSKPKNDFEKDVAAGGRFWLGPIQATHTLGRYQLIEYKSTPASNSPPDFQSQTMFSGYVDGRGTRHSYNSIEAAIADCITVAHNGYNDQAGEMFIRTLKGGKR